MTKLPSVAVVGATGAVGREMLTVLEQRGFPFSAMRLFASERSAGAELVFGGKSLTVEPLKPGALEGVDVALFSAGSGISKEAAPGAARSGTVVIDNSSAFRMREDVPLVVPEVNPGALGPMLARRGSGGRKEQGGIVANPNCSAIIMLVALDPIRRAFGLERVIVSTYQAASGAGARGMDELRTQTLAAMEGRSVEPEFFHEPYAFNLFSHNTAVDPASGLNVEETKMIEESRKIWNDPGLRLSPTCIRVPVMRAHAESINVTLKKPATTQQILEVLGSAPGVQVVDDRANNRFPTPLKASGRDDVLVGRVRPDQSAGGEKTKGSPGGAHMAFNLFVCGDQLRKGAALNAVQIAELFYSPR